jgi:BirA family biotin operon repressor/biotin-[acetyl-CoA-carboxylase] ligase
MATDDLAPKAVLPLLRGRFGRSYTFLAECASTQEAVPDGAEEGTVVVADVQTAGRGRLGRTWEAAPGTSLLFSVVLTPQVPAERLPGLTLVGAHGVVDALPVNATIKHPNDVLVGGRKVAGILGEARDGRVVLGIGINVNVPADLLPRETVTTPTSLLLETGRHHDRGELLARVLGALERRYDAWLAQP